MSANGSRGKNWAPSDGSSPADAVRDIYSGFIEECVLAQRTQYSGTCFKTGIDTDDMGVNLKYVLPLVKLDGRGGMIGQEDMDAGISEAIAGHARFPG